MKTEYIINEINNHFAEIYRSASGFVNSGELWNFCIATIKNPITMNEIAFANALGIPPVRSLLQIFEFEKKPQDDFLFTAQQSQWMGSLMGFIFKNVLGYKNQKERCRVNQFGVKTATRFLDGNYVVFE